STAMIEGSIRGAGARSVPGTCWSAGVAAGSCTSGTGASEDLLLFESFFLIMPGWYPRHRPEGKPGRTGHSSISQGARSALPGPPHQLAAARGAHHVRSPFLHELEDLRALSQRRQSDDVARS